MAMTFLIVGFVLGALAAYEAARFLAPGLMIEDRESALSFEDTVRTLEGAVREAGWVLSDSKDFNRSLEKEGAVLEPRIHLIKLCKPSYAVEVLKEERRVACLMPCTFAVYEDDAGRVRVSKMNTGLMGKLFGGAVRRVMGESVSKEEKAMLRGILRHA